MSNCMIETYRLQQKILPPFVTTRTQTHKRAHIRSARSAANEHTVSLRNRLFRTSTSPFLLSGAVLPCPCGGAGGRAPRGCRGWHSLLRAGCDGWWRHFLTRACASTTCRRLTGSSRLFASCW